jgi:hypothetical protein
MLETATTTATIPDPQAKVLDEPPAHEQLQQMEPHRNPHWSRTQQRTTTSG